MKKVVIIAAVAFFAVAAVSCSKKHDCKCTVYANGVAMDSRELVDQEKECSEVDATLGAYDEASKTGWKCEEK